MARTVLIGIDLGTTVLKMAAFDARTGAVLAQTAQRLKVFSAADGTREQRATDIDRALRKTVAAIRRELGDAWRRVGGLGLASQGGSGILVDRETGVAHTPMMLWNDVRAQALLADIAKRKPPRFWRALTLLDSPGAGLGRMQWFRRCHPKLFNERNLYVGAGEFLCFMLTGVWRQDAGNALQIGCYDAVRRRLDRRPLDLIGVPLSFVAPLREGHEPLPLSASGARRLGLSEGLPVTGPYIDQEAGYMSAMGASRCPLQCSLGTAWVGNFVLPDTVAGASPFQLVLPPPTGSGRLVVQPLLTGNVSWDWGLTTFIAHRHKKALTQLDIIFSESLFPPHGLIAVPWFTQPNPLESTNLGGGAFFGMSAHTHPHDFLRALAFGMACEAARVFAAVRDSGIIDSVALGGGASRGAFFRTLLAALFAPAPVCWQYENLSAARGALYALSSEAAVAKTQRVPPPDKQVRDRAAAGFALYRKLYAKLYKDYRMSGAFEVSTQSKES